MNSSSRGAYALAAMGDKAAAKATYGKILANTPTALVKDAASRGIEMASK